MGETRSGSSPRRIQVRPPSWVIQSSTVAGPFGPASSTAYWSLNFGLATSNVLAAVATGRCGRCRRTGWAIPGWWSGYRRPPSAREEVRGVRRPPEAVSDRRDPGGTGVAIPIRSDRRDPRGRRPAERGRVGRLAGSGRDGGCRRLAAGSGFTGVNPGPAVMSG